MTFIKTRKTLAEFQEWKKAKASKGKENKNEHLCGIQSQC